jgi:hypothetical protein
MTSATTVYYKVIENLDLVKTRNPEWHEAVVNVNIDIFEMSHEESVSYSKHLENLEEIKHTNSPSPATLPVDNDKLVSVTSSVGRSSKNSKSSNMWCHYCDK